MLCGIQHMCGRMRGKVCPKRCHSFCAFDKRKLEGEFNSSPGRAQEVLRPFSELRAINWAETNSILLMSHVQSPSLKGPLSSDNFTQLTARSPHAHPPQLQSQLWPRHRHRLARHRQRHGEATVGTSGAPLRTSRLAQPAGRAASSPAAGTEGAGGAAARRDANSRLSGHVIREGEVASPLAWRWSAGVR